MVEDTREWNETRCRRVLCRWRGCNREISFFLSLVHSRMEYRWKNVKKMLDDDNSEDRNVVEGSVIKFRILLSKIFKECWDVRDENLRGRRRWKKRILLWIPGNRIDNIIIMDYRHIDILHSCVILLEPAIKWCYHVSYSSLSNERTCKIII